MINKTMKNMICNAKPVRILIFAALALITVPCQLFAAFSLSVRPYEGGNELRFGKVATATQRINKEVVINITSDIATQYRVSNFLAEPISNSQGVALPANNFVVYGVRGTNKYGTINADHDTPVSFSRTLLYTSNQTGTSDSFTLVYSLIQPQNLPSGTYRGRIVFNLEPISASQAPVTVVLNVYIQLEVESTMQLSTVSGSGMLNLNSQAQRIENPQISFSMTGDLGAQFRITQFLSRPLESQAGEQLPEEAVVFEVSNARTGSAATQPTSLTQQQERIYTSDQKGSADSFFITYALSQPELLSAGKYRSAIKYFVESPLVNKQLQSLDLEVDVARIFDLSLTPEMGGTIEFRKIKPNQPPRTSVVLVEVKSNTGKRYQIGQSVLSALTNKEGDAFPQKYFTVREESFDTKGTLKINSATEVKTGDTTLFISDRKGSSDKFRLIYELTPTPNVKTGDYGTRITYSISEI